MKKYLLLVLAVISTAFTSCSSDEDKNCKEEFYRIDQLQQNFLFPTTQFQVKGIQIGQYTVIKNETEFQNRVNGSSYYKDIINFKDFDLLVGQVKVQGVLSIIDIIPMLKENCSNNSVNKLEVEMIFNKGINNPIVTYHALVPKSRTYNIEVRTSVNLK
ncbi:hypothetical protein HX049_03390 [Myroides odoratimimus]|uniref:hypothetical protein n=1 Tax=Myroides odoratimimus TaxID=76832 RepID=UPI002578E1B7|nr:hypothetical protein [Myroides odoratimimus]MDM1396223.1 hypothetical protein [Myroides odoratimimus]